jgi:pimeloyl-ACP methyl ester carboxylesterase
MRIAMLILLAGAMLASGSLLAAGEAAGVAGYWDGAIEIPGMQLGIRVHLERDELGAWSGTIDIPMQGAKGLPLADTAVGDSTVAFGIAGVPGDPRFSGVLDGDSIAGSFTQNGQTFHFTLTRGTAEAPGRPQDPRPPFPYSRDEMTFQSGEVTLAGTLTIPEGEGPFPAVILLSGSGPQNRDEELFNHRPFLVIADYLSRRGIAVLRCDDRGVGGSTGDVYQSTTADFATDALAALALLRQHARIAPNRIGLLGHSEGAICAPMAAARSEQVAFLVLLAAPAVPGPELLALQTERITRAEGADEDAVQRLVALNRELTTTLASDGDLDRAREKARDVILRQNELMPLETRPSESALDRMVQAQLDNLFSPWFQFYVRCDPRDALREVTVPVLALYGALDLQVLGDQNRPELESALAAAGNADVTVRTLPGLNHLFQHADTGTVSEYGQIDETLSPEVLELVCAWITERFGNRP